MELDELKQGLQGLQGGEPAVPPVGGDTPMPAAPVQPWLNMDNLMGSYGGWIGQDRGLGELLLGQLRARGVDTQAATEAMLREILTTLVDDLNMLQQRLTGFTQAVAQQMQEVSAVKDSVDTALAQAGGTPASQDVGGPLGPDMGGGMEPPPESAPPAEGEMPPESSGEMSPEGEVPPEGEGEMPPAGEEPPAGEPSAEEPSAEEMPPEGTPSDARVKKIKGYVLSDAGMKKIMGTIQRNRKPAGMTFSPEMVAAVRRFP